MRSCASGCCRSGKERIAWAKMAAVLVAARLCEPSSELHIAEDWYRRTALCDLLQLGDEEVNKDRLYRGLDHLLAHKAALEAHLSQRCGELFAVENEVLLYDVTSTYLRGPGRGQPAGAARLLPRSSARLQAGVHRPGGDLRRLSSGLRGVCRQHPRFADLADHRRHHGGPAWHAGARLDRRPRHGERRQSGMAAPDRPALHHRRAEGGAEEVRRRTRRDRTAGARSTRASRSSSRATPRPRDGDPVPLGRSAQQRAGHARQVQPADRRRRSTRLAARIARSKQARSIRRR